MFTAPAHARAPRTLVVALAAVIGAATLTLAPTAHAASRSVTIDDPAPVSAGQVELRGTVSSGTPETTTVLYVVDNSGSTSNPAGLDCDGDGTAGEAGDDLNGDTSIGDPLDCEIGAVGALNETLEASSGASVVSLETFASTAEAINLDPPTSPPVLFAAPGDKGAGSEPLLVTASIKLQRDPVAGTSFDPAVATALQTLAGAPAGPKYIMFLSDGIGSATQETLDSLRTSGVHLRSFVVGNRDGCGSSEQLAALSAATGDNCYGLESPEDLAGAITTAQPTTVSSVTVTVGGKTFAADVDIAGGWRTTLTLGAGTYTAIANASFSDGGTARATRTFAVKKSGSGVPDGTVDGVAPKKTGMVVRRPAPTLSRVASKVVGRVGVARKGKAPKSVSGLQNATVVLKGRTKPGKAWVKLGTARVGSTGKFTVVRTKKTGIRQLKVVLLPYKRFAGSSKKVSRPKISACKFTRQGKRFTVACKTIAKNGTKSRLLKNGEVVARTRVRSGVVKYVGRGRLDANVLVVDVKRNVHYRLTL